MSIETTVFYRGNTQRCVDFTAEEISSDAAVVLLDKIERKHNIIKYFTGFIPDRRDPGKITHSLYKMLKQRVFTLMQGYEDCNDVHQLKNDPLLKDVLDGELASQPSLSRFENSLDKHAIFGLCYAWVDRYVDSLQGRTEIIIDIDATDDPTHGDQQMSLFNGFYMQHMYNELLLHDGLTGQLILPVLRPGNSHSNRWYVSILKRVITKIRAKYPDMRIIIRGDSGFSCPAFYKLAEKSNLLFVLGIATNAVIKQRVGRACQAVQQLYVSRAIKHQHFCSYSYQANSWDTPQTCYAKVESTGKGLNVRHIVSNLPASTARQIYVEVYVQRAEASENRIKELKNMCFSDRLSNHSYWANFLRLFISSMAYELFLKLKEAIKKTGVKIAEKWQIDTIRVRLLKVGGTIKKTTRRIYYRLSRAFVWQDLFRRLIAQ